MGAQPDYWFDWLIRQRFAHHAEDERVALVGTLLQVRDRVLHYADIASGSRVLDLGWGTGLLAFGAVERREVGESLAQAYVEYMSELVARFGLRQRVPVAWIKGVRQE